ncbi:response regulator [Sphingomonas ginkgonis]|uniref:Response regulator n=1 Tax=Sphingomonas ginkgonis TaxID=2315330 RepID=A0A3R9X702_9SPHN|nr:response regulator [Sphingomonas ginkgonis]RST30315.1 response regulator [Sphingomonas ginkgonis]
MIASLAGKKILIVEDEYFIASDLAWVLAREQAVVVGPVSDLARGLSLVAEGGVDAAVLDVNLEGAHSYAIADRLGEVSVPFMFLTGYDSWSLPESYRDVPRLSKPVPMQKVLNCVRQLLQD